MQAPNGSQNAMVMIDQDELRELMEAKKILEQQRAQLAASKVQQQEQSIEDLISQGFQKSIFSTPFEKYGKEESSIAEESTAFQSSLIMKSLKQQNKGRISAFCELEDEDEGLEQQMAQENACVSGFTTDVSQNQQSEDTGMSISTLTQNIMIGNDLMEMLDNDTPREDENKNHSQPKPFYPQFAQE